MPAARRYAAYTFIDYDVDPNGLARSLSRAQLRRRAQGVAEELSSLELTDIRPKRLAKGRGVDT